ncbi:MAG: 2,3-bisphosphoglycerate-independent phosphoglycerate mutase [Clostridia bacterium]|nr:2,3-bisphosphoglycerate-independent phosphoglycerate mutase [Clostridia bacterium]
MNKPKPLALLILDGYGLGEPGPDNAVWEAKTPVMDALLASCPNTKISASGLDVGLPEGQMGNSEVGHTNIGAGRVVYQDLPRITKAIEDGSFFENPAYIKAMDDAKAKNASLHILGLLSDGGVHSHITHIFAILEMSKRRGLDKVFFHCFLDGRDTGPETGAGYIKALADKCAEEGLGRIATVQGRFWGMDRDKRWERLQKGYDAIVRGEGVMNADPVDAVLKSYSKDITDEFVAPVICDPAGMIKSGDSVIFMNFRPDRAREMTWALNGYLPEGSTVSTEKLDLSYVCTAQYDAELQLPTAFPPETLHGTMGEYLSELGLRQFRIAETEKYAHVTFFFNGGVEKVYDGEDRVLIQSPREFPTYDLIPEMSAYKVKDELISHMDSGKYDFYVCNFANCDMVGHTGVTAAAIKAVETVDTCLGEVITAAKRNGIILAVTADHGNADIMKKTDGSPHTAHTTNLVPFVICGTYVKLEDGGRLSDIAPTLLELMQLGKPAEMTGRSMIIK